MRLGIGDDAAILASARNTEWVLSCDAFLEGVHFLVASYPPDSVGYKSLVRATSDLAAMGAKPRFFLADSRAAGAAAPGSGSTSSCEEWGALPDCSGMRLVGGDTTKSATVSISITVIGEVASRAGSHAFGCAAGRHYICERHAGPRRIWVLS